MDIDLTGQSAIITGASRGLGLEISKVFARAGANVLMCARNLEALEQGAGEVRSVAGSGQRIVYLAVDVSVPSDVHRMVAIALKEFRRVDILVNNAGGYGPKGLLEEVDWEAWVQAIRINLMGSVYSCRELLPHFKANHKGKIIQLSGGGATSPMPRLSAYAASKAAIIRFVETLAQEVQGDGIDVNAIAPGPLNTGMLDEVLAAGPEKVGRDFYERSLRQKEQGGASLGKAASLALFLASPMSDGITGKLVSAVWDPWEDFADHREELQSTDIYTLRRIIPKDRGYYWGEKV